MINPILSFSRYEYTNSPLTEAIFELKFLDTQDSNLQDNFFNSVSSIFSEKKDNQNIQGVMQAWNEYNDKCVQMGPGLISLNDTNYVNYENFSNNLQIVLDGCFDLLPILEIERIGYRCINRFFIPEQNALLSDYFCFGFMVPNILVNVNSFGFNMTKEITFHDMSYTIIFKFYSDFLRENERESAFILDLDVFTTKNIQSDKKAVFNMSSDCHELEKAIFESLILDKTRILMGAKPLNNR
jgi:uncharacterized protein (TIGR04255 family)